MDVRPNRSAGRRAATVLVPTHTHAETLRCSVATALSQTISDIEVFIVGDGVPDATRVIAAELAAADSRVRFFDFPKGPSRGELHRHRVLAEATGDIVCYLFDDDLWLPEHIEVMRDLLRDADFAFSMPVVVGTDGRMRAHVVDLQSRLHRRLFTDSRSDTAAVPTCAAHTLAFYRRLPFGWRTTPPGASPDKYMWAQCLADPGCVARSTSRPTAVIFPAPPRREWSAHRRVSELRDWSRRLQDPGWRRGPWRELQARAEDRNRRRRFALWCYARLLCLPVAGAPVIGMARRLRALGRTRFKDGGFPRRQPSRAL